MQQIINRNKTNLLQKEKDMYYLDILELEKNIKCMTLSKHRFLYAEMLFLRKIFSLTSKIQKTFPKIL